MKALGDGGGRVDGLFHVLESTAGADGTENRCTLRMLSLLAARARRDEGRVKE